MAPFQLTYADAPHTCILHIAGDVDVAVVPELQMVLSDALASGCENVVFDLADVTYADSSALGLLVWLDRRIMPQHGRLVLAGANANVSHILELSGLVGVAASIATSDDVSSALGGLDLPASNANFLWHRQVDFPLDVNRLSAVRDEVSELIGPLGFSESAVFDIKVALGEALANALRHGRPEAGEFRVGLGVDAFDDRVVLEVTDNGPGFDGSAASTDDLYAPGGRGIMFMRALMDKVEFSPADGAGTVVRLVKHRPSDAH